MTGLREPGKTHYRTIFLSGIHLGTRGCRADTLIEFLKAHTCDRLYLVGDIIDGWRSREAFHWPQAHTNVMRRFLTMSKRGTEVSYVTRHRNEFLRQYSDMEFTGIKLVDAAVHRTARGQRLLVEHGEAFIIVRHHHWIAPLGDLGYGLLVTVAGHLNHWRARIRFRYWSLSAWVKWRIKRALDFVGGDASVSHNRREQGFDGVICGHIHRAEIAQYDDVRYMNCGDWVESCTALVEDDVGMFRVIRWADEMKCKAQALPLAPVTRLRA